MQPVSWYRYLILKFWGQITGNVGHCCKCNKKVGFFSAFFPVFPSQYIGEKCPHLEQLELRGCTKISADSLHRLVSTCDKLHSLDLSHEENQQNVRIKVLLYARFPHLWNSYQKITLIFSSMDTGISTEFSINVIKKKPTECTVDTFYSKFWNIWAKFEILFCISSDNRGFT